MGGVQNNTSCHSLTPGEVDFVLIYPESNEKNKPTHADSIVQKLKDMKSMLIVNLEKLGSYNYVKLRCTFDALCSEAEDVKLEMALRDCTNPRSEYDWCCKGFNEMVETLSPDNDVVDFVSAPFVKSEKDKFEGYQNENTFFRRSQRSLLVHHILSNMNIDINVEDDSPTCMTVKGNPEFHKVKETGLDYFLMKKVFTDFLVLHEDPQTLMIQPSSAISEFPAGNSGKKDLYKPFQSWKDEGTTKNLVTEMIDEWTSCKNFYKFQPLWKIRNYFGEKIAFYFAWTGMLVSSLWIPTFIGLLVFVYGLVLRVSTDRNDFHAFRLNGTDGIKSKLLELMNLIHWTFDNNTTPFFAMAVCIWGTVFLELWKRKSATLAYEWDVNDFQASEPDRPQFIGTTSKDHPIVTDKKLWYYPLKFQLGKYLISFVAALFMIGIVVASLIGVIVYRVTMHIDVCPGTTGEECLMLKTVTSVILNAISITILGRVYYYIAIWLTNKENHKTQSKYDDALIIKLFAFQFANSYSSCFYIAFFIERVDTSVLTGRGEAYQDSCDGQSCMSQLTFQIIALMLIKPLPKFFLDVILPILKNFKSSCLHSRHSNEVQPCMPCAAEEGRSITKNSKKEKEASICIVCKQEIAENEENGTGQHVLCRERKKPKLVDFTLGEYTEKVILYGYLMLFAASFPLAPLLAVTTNLIDIRVDGWRLLKQYRRPIAFITQDIGIWYTILTFVNYCGVLSNAFLVAFASSWGQRYDLVGKLIIVIGFEHIVFVLKYLLAYLIPDVPVDVQEAMRKEKYEIRKKFQTTNGETCEGQLVLANQTQEKHTAFHLWKGNHINVLSDVLCLFTDLHQLYKASTDRQNGFKATDCSWDYLLFFRQTQWAETCDYSERRKSVFYFRNTEKCFSLQ